ncbi:MAG TPA: hypothetical protein VFV72_07720 [Candidatus Limnocylindrales bacterium]|nr:hypothetical protein [Candidatus Limnocylindrales bacterium]
MAEQDRVEHSSSNGKRAALFGQGEHLHGESALTRHRGLDSGNQGRFLFGVAEQMKGYQPWSG